MFISKGDRKKTSDEEAKEYLDKGYQRLCGSLLWAARNVYCECAVGISFLCRVMSKPSKKAWEAALHMLQWMWQEKERGIIYRSDRGSAPIAFSDASNQADPEDGLVQAGFNIMMAGGPVVYGSRKLKHCSPTGAASHVEYMALNMCSQSVVWLRQMLEELECDDLIEEATTIYGDNKAANQLCKEDFISTGNMYIFLSYHSIKELEQSHMIDVQDKRTKWNIADVFTKPVDQAVARRLFGRCCGYVDFRGDGDEDDNKAT